MNDKPKRFWDSWWFAIFFILALMLVPLFVFVAIMYFVAANRSFTGQ